MAPLPANSTPVLFVDYSFNGEGHTMQFRGADGIGAAALVAVANAYLAEIDVIACTGWQVTACNFRAEGTNFTVPAPMPTAITPGGGSLNPVNNPRFITHVARGLVTGRRWRLTVFGLAFAMPEDYRLALTDVSALAAAHNVLAAAMDAGTLATIGNDEGQLYDYINCGFNSYWEREQRG